MNSDSQSWNHYKKIRQQGKCACTRLHKATFRNYTYVLNSGDPLTVSFIQTTLTSPPPPHPFSSLYYQPNTLIPPHCNTIKATQHLKIMIWVWCRTLNTYSCMRQKKKTLANYCNDENSLRQSWWKTCRYDLQKKRHFYILEKFVISYNRAQRHLHSQDLVKCAGDRKIILCCIKDQDSWIIWESLTYYMHVLVLTY